MSQANPSADQWKFATFAFAAVAVLISACSSNGAPGAVNQTIPGASPAGQPTPPYTWTYTKIDDTANGNNSRVTGIEDSNVNSKLVGLNGTTKSDYSSWVSTSPWTTFTLRNYPSGVTYMSSVEGNYQAGTVYNPTTTLACTTCGFIYHDNTSKPWTLLEDPKENSTCPVTEVLGLGDSQVVVGYYEVDETSGCQDRPFEAYNADSSGETYVDFSVPGTWISAQATGINESNDAVGTMTTASGATTGWFYTDAVYCTGLQYPYATNTYPMGINWQDQVVGYYTDSAGIAHGFLLNNPVDTNTGWETINYPTTNIVDPYTVVSNITDHHWISGWYKDSNGHDNGFVGTCSNCGSFNPKQALKARHRIREMLAHGEASSSCFTTSGNRRKPV